MFMWHFAILKIQDGNYETGTEFKFAEMNRTLSDIEFNIFELLLFYELTVLRLNF